MTIIRLWAAHCDLCKWLGPPRTQEKVATTDRARHHRDNHHDNQGTS